VKTRRASSRRATRRKWIARHDFFADLDDVAVGHRFEDRWREGHALQKKLDRGAAAKRFDQVVDFALPLGARERGLALDERRQFALEHGNAARLRARRRRFRAGERGGKRGAKHDAERRDVILRDPAAQCQQRRIEDWIGIGRGDEGLRCHAVASGAVAHDESHLLPAAYRNHDAAADGYAFGEVVRDRVGERLVKWEREGDRDEH